jgi:hypothetical protein
VRWGDGAVREDGTWREEIAKALRASANDDPAREAALWWADAGGLPFVAAAAKAMIERAHAVQNTARGYDRTWLEILEPVRSGLTRLGSCAADTKARADGRLVVRFRWPQGGWVAAEAPSTPICDGPWWRDLKAWPAFPGDEEPRSEEDTPTHIGGLPGTFRPMGHALHPTEQEKLLGFDAGQAPWQREELQPRADPAAVAILEAKLRGST